MNQTVKKILRSTQVLFPGVVNAKFTIYDCIYRFGGRVFKQEFNGLRHFNFRGKLLLDVGANRGQSIAAFKNLAPGSRIIAFEPNRPLADHLARLYRSDPTVRIEACGLSDEPGTLTLHIPSYRGFLFDGLATVEPDVRNWFNRERFFFFNPRRVSVQQFAVPARTLDSYNLTPALIKLTAQRSEISILRGARETVQKHRPVILAAWPWDEEVSILRTYGYCAYGYDRGHFHRGTIREFTWFLLQEHVDIIQNDGTEPRRRPLIS